MSFESDMQRIIQQTNVRMNTFVRYIIMGVMREVVRKSPVDTGRFKGNWQYGMDSMPSGELSTVDPSGSFTLNAIMRQIPSEAVGHVHYIVNNLPYAQALEDGHSTQSPPGNMVAGTVAQFQQIVNEAARS